MTVQLLDRPSFDVGKQTESHSRNSVSEEHKDSCTGTDMHQTGKERFMHRHRDTHASDSQAQSHRDTHASGSDL